MPAPGSGEAPGAAPPNCPEVPPPQAAGNRAEEGPGRNVRGDPSECPCRRPHAGGPTVLPAVKLVPASPSGSTGLWTPAPEPAWPPASPVLQQHLQHLPSPAPPLPGPPTCVSTWGASAERTGAARPLTPPHGFLHLPAPCLPPRPLCQRSSHPPWVPGVWPVRSPRFSVRPSPGAP